ncbi:hypothetical protein O988_04524 [Pseudogymnoascus sp. VKM F-3808]|nr:hypothetical protein O988_04524 [Pseudogymnoascus sp. VKM F-3808]
MGHPQRRQRGRRRPQFDDTSLHHFTTPRTAIMSMFRSKKLDLGCFVNIKVIRDHTKRKVFAEHETERQALRYIIRNVTLPNRMRAQAQLELSQMHCYTRPSQIRNRCIEGGKGRGVLRDFKMSRYNFRMHALAGDIPGVKKASW